MWSSDRKGMFVKSVERIFLFVFGFIVATALWMIALCATANVDYIQQVFRILYQYRLNH